MMMMMRGESGSVANDSDAVTRNGRGAGGAARVRSAAAREEAAAAHPSVARLGYAVHPSRATRNGRGVSPADQYGMRRPRQTDLFVHGLRLGRESRG